VNGLEHAQRALDSGSGVILLGTHVGGWEVATAAPGALLSAPVSVVVADDWLAWAIEHARVAAGLRVLYASGSGLEAARLLRRGEVLLMLGDDTRYGHLTERVRFLDAEADLAAGPVRLSRVTGAPIVTFTVLPVARRRWSIIVDGSIDAPARAPDRAGERTVLQQIADRWSQTIGAQPEQWAACFPIRWHGPAI
jgi:lauroyl/myristoyl acyltransferase